MDNFEHLGAALLRQREAMHASWVKRLRQASTTDRGLDGHLREASTELARIVPEGLSPEEFADACTEGEFEQAVIRLGECARCPSYGGLCAQPGAQCDYKPGEQPYWNEEREPPGLSWRVCDRWQEFQLRRRLRMWGIGTRLLDARLSNYDPQNASQQEAKAACEQFVDRFPSGDNLALFGAVGVGKTHLAVAVLAALAAKLRGALFMQAGDFFRALRSDDGKNDELIARARSVTILVIDDLGKQRTTEWVREQSDIVINDRWQNRRSTIVTTNGDMDYIEGAFGPAFASRIETRLCCKVLDGDDYRTTGNV